MHKKVDHIKVTKDMTVNDLVNAMQKSGVMGAGRMARAVSIYEKMITDPECKIFFGFAGAMVPGGMKELVIDMLKNGWIDVFVTTGANLTHDLIEALGYSHYQGTENADDKELREKQIDRIYDSFMPNKVYEGMEDFFAKHFDELAKEKSIKDFLWKLGSLLPDSNSILKICSEKQIPVFCPAISDSGIGLMMWGNIAKGKSAETRAFDDLKEMLGIAWKVKKAGVFYLGGGVPKNYIQQAMQFAPKGADYGVQIKVDRPEFGGSSGADLKEGISWGKMSTEGDFVDVICDATIALPIIVAALKSRIQ
ncbi:deoxyhypusine synthase family protein [Candidatus Woesearchaeota archaeon]|nr:deoxyhypusine synthase family protein [Candidatus Woesearchaeota archaeon]MBW3014314.1 deoxyhypusine synthase family protein [Candidatus Woesearchaeota archaeon]